MAVQVTGKSSGFSVKMKIGGTDEDPKLMSHSLGGVRYGAEHNEALYAIGQSMVPLFDGTLHSMERSMTSLLGDA